VRIALETLAIRLAVARISAGQVARLRTLNHHAEAGLRAGNAKPALEFDREMHRVILECCGNRPLQEIMARINDFVSLFRNIGARTPFHRGYTYRHREILRALDRRDADAAAQSLAEHISRSRDELFRDFQQRNLLQPSPDARSRRRGGAPADAASVRSQLPPA
jgi:DNA-binding GntR family transcriptional regulator